VEPERYIERLHSAGYDTEALGVVEDCMHLKAYIARALKPRPNQRFRTVRLARQVLSGDAA
jgi:hypothetical protein